MYSGSIAPRFVWLITSSQSASSEAVSKSSSKADESSVSMSDVGIPEEIDGVVELRAQPQVRERGRERVNGRIKVAGKRDFGEGGG